MEPKTLAAVEITYLVGQKFFPTTHYDEFISALQLSEDARTLIIDTTENRRFTIGTTEEVNILPLGGRIARDPLQAQTLGSQSI